MNAGAVVGIVAAGLVGSWAIRSVSRYVRRETRSQLVAGCRGRFRVEARARLEHYVVDTRTGATVQGPIPDEDAAAEICDVYTLAYMERPR